MSGHVYFVGAGPGAPDLITVRGADLLARADVVIYADSLVDPRLCAYARPDAEIIGSSSLKLEEVLALVLSAAQEDKMIVRLHSGDPAIYGAIHEQIVRLDDARVPWTIVPGVSSAFAAAAALGVELTVPEVAQSVIMTRISGRASTVPERENLRAMAAHRTTLVLFLSVNYITKVVRELMEGGYERTTPVAVLHRVTWPDEEIVRGTLADIAGKVRMLKWNKQALILVGEALREGGFEEQRSRLYSGDYTHIFRQSDALKARTKRSS